MKYLSLFKLVITHNYYVNERCTDFDLVLSAETETLLKNHRCVVKTQADGLTMLMAVDEAGLPFIPLSDEARFCFYLRLNNQDFPYFTELSALSDCDVPLFSNQPLNAGVQSLSLSAKRATQVEPLKSEIASSNEAFTLTGLPLSSSTAADFQLSDTTATVVAFDPVSKVIHIDTGTLQADSVFSVSYPVAPKQVRGTFAEVAIYPDTHVPTEGVAWEDAALFQIDFVAKQAHWAYYCVSGFSPTLGEMTITDQSTTELDRVIFSNKNRKNLDSDLDPNDAIALSLNDQYPGFQKIRFLSDQPVPCRQAMNPSLELYLGDDRIAEALPNPSFKNNSNIMMTENSTSKKEVALFQVIKFLTA